MPAQFASGQGQPSSIRSSAPGATMRGRHGIRARLAGLLRTGGTEGGSMVFKTWPIRLRGMEGAAAAHN